MWYGEYIVRFVRQTCQFFSAILFPTTDNAVATPINNYEVIEKLVNRDYKPYADINNSVYAPEVAGGIGGLTLAALLIKLITLCYQLSRKAEKNSYYFFFERLLYSPSCDLILMLQNSSVDSAILANYSFFYNPDNSPLVLWFRRLFCYGERRKGLKELNQYIYNRIEDENKTRKAIVGEINKIIMEDLVRFFNLYGSFKPTENTTSIFHLKTSELEQLKNKNNESLDQFRLIEDKGKAGHYTIGFTETFWTTYLEKNPYKKIERTRKETIWQRFAEPLLADLGQASFIYWIFVFVFYFIPSVAVVAGTTIAIPPLGIAVGVLLLRWLYKGSMWFFNRVRSKYSEIGLQEEVVCSDSDEVIYRRQAEKNFVKEYGCHVLLENLTRFQPERRVVFENSKLLKDLKVITKKRFRSLWFFKGAWEGLINGCFLPFFVAWLFTDFAKWIGSMIIGGALIFGPITLGIIAGTTLFLGLAYGIYRAIYCFREQKNRHDILIEKIKVLESKLSGVEIVDLPLSKYDRFIRRGSIDNYFSTRVKKFFNRIWASFKALGTGGLVFRLIILGTLVSFGLTFPYVVIVSCIAVFAVVFAARTWHSYNIKSKQRQAEEVVDHLIKSVYRLKVEQPIEQNKSLFPYQDDNQAEEDPNNPALLASDHSEDRKFTENRQIFVSKPSSFSHISIKRPMKERDFGVRSVASVQCMKKEKEMQDGDNKNMSPPPILANNSGKNCSDSTANSKLFVSGESQGEAIIKPVLRKRAFTDPVIMKRLASQRASIFVPATCRAATALSSLQRQASYRSLPGISR